MVENRRNEVTHCSSRCNSHCYMNRRSKSENQVLKCWRTLFQSGGDLLFIKRFTVASQRQRASRVPSKRGRNTRPGKSDWEAGWYEGGEDDGGTAELQTLRIYNKGTQVRCVVEKRPFVKRLINVDQPRGPNVPLKPSRATVHVKQTWQFAHVLSFSLFQGLWNGARSTEMWACFSPNAIFIWTWYPTKIINGHVDEVMRHRSHHNLDAGTLLTSLFPFSSEFTASSTMLSTIDFAGRMSLITAATFPINQGLKSLAYYALRN